MGILKDQIMSAEYNNPNERVQSTETPETSASRAETIVQHSRSMTAESVEQLDKVRLDMINKMNEINLERERNDSRLNDLLIECSRLRTGIEYLDQMIAEYNHTAHKLDEQITAFAKGTTATSNKAQDRFNSITESTQPVNEVGFAEDGPTNPTKADFAERPYEPRI